MENHELWDTLTEFILEGGRLYDDGINNMHAYVRTHARTHKHYSDSDSDGKTAQNISHFMKLIKSVLWSC